MCSRQSGFQPAKWRKLLTGSNHLAYAFTLRVVKIGSCSRVGVRGCGQHELCPTDTEPLTSADPANPEYSSRVLVLVTRALYMFKTDHLLLHLFNEKAQPCHKVTNLAMFTCKRLAKRYGALVIDV